MPERIDCGLYWTVDIRNFRQLFVDNLVVARLENCRKTLHPFEKFGRPVVFPQHEWERYGCAQSLVLHDAREKWFRCWYTPLPTMETDDSTLPGTCYAQSRDGIDWEKPLTDRFPWHGGRTNFVLRGGIPDKQPNTLTEVLNGVVLRDDEPDPNYRFRGMLFRCGQLNEFLEDTRGYFTAHSPDGIRWKIDPEPVLSRRRDDPELSDAFSFMYDPLKNRYVCFTKKVRLCPDGVGDQGCFKRIRGISFSQDFVHWSRPQTMLQPDDRDDPDVNFYNLAGFVYEGMYLGLLEIYHSGLEGPRARTTDLQLISSRDGETWWRAGDRETILSAGGPGEWDRGGVYAWGNHLISGPDGRLWFYYLGASLHHIPPELGYFPDDEPYRGAGLARLRRDGFMSVDAGNTEGTLLTKRLQFKGTRLHINARTAPDGYIKADVYTTKQEISHPSEKPLGMRLGGVLPGFSCDRCQPVQGDHLDAVVEWAGSPGLEPFENQPVAIRFRLKNAALYSFWIA